ncbi:competence protein ComEA [Mangrovibacillus cuniculi]|uniref:phospholipase D n=2 Tax=Mangrovibacillus cuniculi TaxID=2593652 RepID=A0A7S8CEI3_9BACI|nr:competence protein ComEA [Mangrovibacillus cuniculi]
MIGSGVTIPEKVEAASANDVVINEIAWMGTTASYADEWVELHNTSSSAVDLSGWTLASQDGSLSVQLSGTIPAGGYYLLERTDDTTIPDKQANLIYSGSLDNTGEILSLKDASGTIIDSVDAWHAGDNTSKATMERVNPLQDGTISSSWATSTTTYAVGYGSPMAGSPSGAPGTTTGEQLNQVSEELNAMNVYFNKSADPTLATAGNEANYHVNLEDRLIHRLNQATTSIDFATYEINLPRVVETLIAKAAQGVDVRVIADAKDATDPHYAERFETMRLYIEQMVRGTDDVIGTADDVHVFSDSAMMVVEDSAKRSSFGLPADFSDIPVQTVMIGNGSQTGHVMVDAEQKAPAEYYSPGTQMHNKFAIVDDRWVFTGTWNFTITGLYGSEENMANGVLDGNQQHVVEIHNADLAQAYEIEFNEMWGSNSLTPNPQISNFSTRKVDNTPKEVMIGDKRVEVYFSAGDNAVGRLRDLVRTEAQVNTYFTIFAWSDQQLVDELKYKWEGSYNDLQGTLTGFDIKGVFDSDFWNQWWSASVDMTGRTASQTSTGNPNTRWANPAPVYQDAEARKLHAKTMLIDVDTSSDPTVVVGSTNWSNNGNDINDENMLIIHDAAIANQFKQEFAERYRVAGGAF